MPKLKAILGACSITWAILACTRLNIPLGVTIRAPSDGETLGIGKSFRVVADSDLDQPPSQLTLFEIRLWNPASEYAVTWQEEIASNGGSHILDASFPVPADAPPGEDYKLTVSVLPFDGESDELRYAFADTIRVRVVALP